MWEGGYADQPHLLMMELNVVCEVEIEMDGLWRSNQARAQKQQQSEIEKALRAKLGLD